MVSKRIKPMPENESVVVAPTPSVTKSSVRELRRSVRLGFKEKKLTPENEIVEVAPTSSVTKSSVRELRRSVRLGCKKELMPLKERCVETTPSFTVKKRVEAPIPDMKDYHYYLFGKDLKTLVAENNYRVALMYARRGLELYKKSHKGAEFEIEKVLYRMRMRITCPKLEGNQHWYHVCFTAKPKNSHSSDASSPKHFFAELLLNYGSNNWNAKHCYTFEPNFEAGFEHGCIICTTEHKIHPGPSEYHAGAALTYTRLEHSVKSIFASGIKFGKR